MTTERSALLIADIGGYTEYMSSHRMSLAHAEVNTGRMLEKIIEAAPGFELIEIEGDAAFLARRADAPKVRDDPTLDSILRAAGRMHEAFHLEREYVAANLCPCSGCKGMSDLKLKFVAHVGDVARQSIRGRIKLVGIDVILAHRLLKNGVPIPEYVLLSNDLRGTNPDALPDSAKEISEELEGIGTVDAYFVDVADLDTDALPSAAPSMLDRLGATLSAVGRGLPYMLGIKRTRSAR